MAVNRNLVRNVAAIVGTAGPIVAKYLKEHPEITQSVQDAVTKLVAKRTSGPEGMIDTVIALREQVSYLRTSADDEGEVRRAADWSRRLDNLEHAAQMLRDGSLRKEAKVVKERLAALRAEILTAFITEQAEDAEARQIGRGEPGSTG